MLGGLSWRSADTIEEGSKVPYRSAQEIEAIARRVVTAYKKLPALRGRHPNIIQPELLVCGLLRLSVVYHRLSLNGTILGLTACGEVGVPIYDNPNKPEYYFLDGNTVLIEKSLTEGASNVGRRHFTLIHEACHQIFRMLFPEDYMGTIARRQIHYCRETTSSRVGDWEEWRTNRLASAVLMPEDMVRENMDAFGLDVPMRMVNRVFASIDYSRFSDMAAYMGVSKKALSIRMKQLGLLKADYLDDPYALVNIYPQEDEIYEEDCHGKD